MQQMIIRPWVYPGIRDYAELNHEAILYQVCKYFRIEQELLLMRRRWVELVYPRQVFTYLCKMLLPISGARIGRILGQDHTTVIHSIKTINDLIEYDDTKRSDIETITNHLKANYRLG